MPEFEHTRSAVPPFSPAVRDRSYLEDQDPDSSYPDDTPAQREGLPPGYRMRHDAHYVDQLTTRSTAPHVRMLRVRDIDGPRGADASRLGALTHSIARHGVLQPLLVRARGDRFEVIAGSARLAAAALAGRAEVPCIVLHADDAQATVLAGAENTRASTDAALEMRSSLTTAVPAASTAVVPGAALRELTSSFSTIGSCLHLLSERDGALRDRVALDLVRTEVGRATRLVQCLDVLSHDPTISETMVPVVPLVDQVVEASQPEARLAGVSLTVKRGDPPLTASGDVDWLPVALGGALGGVLALVQQARPATVDVLLAGSAGGASVMVEIAQQAVTLPRHWLDRLFDVGWTSERPGGYQAAIELAAARRLVELHRGAVEVLPGDRGGCRVVLLLPAA